MGWLFTEKYRRRRFEAKYEKLELDSLSLRLKIQVGMLSG